MAKTSTLPQGSKSGDSPQDWHAQFSQAVVQAGIELFAAHGISFDSTDTRCGTEAESSECAFLGVAALGGPSFNGSVVLQTNEEFLRHSNTTLSAPADWMAELANQFVGRIKNRQLRDGISLRRMPPVVVTGNTARLAFPCKGIPLIVLTNRQGSLLIWMNSEPSTDDFQVKEPDDSVLTEGEMVLF